MRNAEFGIEFRNRDRFIPHSAFRVGMASVAGLAPARFCLKGRERELLCIHGLLAQGHYFIGPQKWPLESELRRHFLCFRQACRLTTPSSDLSFSPMATIKKSCHHGLPRIAALRHRHNDGLRRTKRDAKRAPRGTGGLVAATGEQSALETDRRFHRCSFRLRLCV